MTSLAERIEAGEVETEEQDGLAICWGQEVILIASMLDDKTKHPEHRLEYTQLVGKVLEGSLDACQALMNEVLPGVKVSMGELNNEESWSVQLVSVTWPTPERWLTKEICLANAKTPALAWLAAIVRAKENDK